MEQTEEGKWLPTTETIEAVRSGNLFVKKIGPAYEIQDKRMKEENNMSKLNQPEHDPAASIPESFDKRLNDYLQRVEKHDYWYSKSDSTEAWDKAIEDEKQILAEEKELGVEGYFKAYENYFCFKEKKPDINTFLDHEENDQILDKEIESVQENGGLSDATIEADIKAEEKQKADYIDEDGNPHWYDEPEQNSTDDFPIFTLENDHFVYPQELYNALEKFNSIEPEKWNLPVEDKGAVKHLIDVAEIKDGDKDKAIEKLNNFILSEEYKREESSYSKILTPVFEAYNNKEETFSYTFSVDEKGPQDGTVAEANIKGDQHLSAEQVRSDFSTFLSNAKLDDETKTWIPPEIGGFQAGDSDSIIGRKINLKDGEITPEGWNDIANIMDCFNDRRYETGRYILVDGDGIVREQVAVSSRLPASSTIIPDSNVLQSITDLAREKNYKVVFAHNHPTGNVQPSPDDDRVNDFLEGFFTQANDSDRFLGHVILGSSGSCGIYSAESHHWVGYSHGGFCDINTINSALRTTPVDVTSYSDFNKLGKIADAIFDEKGWKREDYVPAFYTNPNNNLQCIQFIPRQSFNDPETLKTLVKDTARNSGCTKLFLRPELGSENCQDIENFIKTSGVVKACLYEGNVASPYAANEIFDASDNVAAESSVSGGISAFSAEHGHSSLDYYESYNPEPTPRTPPLPKPASSFSDYLKNAALCPSMDAYRQLYDKEGRLFQSVSIFADEDSLSVVPALSGGGFDFKAAIQSELKSDDSCMSKIADCIKGRNLGYDNFTPDALEFAIREAGQSIGSFFNDLLARYESITKDGIPAREVHLLDSSSNEQGDGQKAVAMSSAAAESKAHEIAAGTDEAPGICYRIGYSVGPFALPSDLKLITKSPVTRDDGKIEYKSNIEVRRGYSFAGFEPGTERQSVVLQRFNTKANFWETMKMSRSAYDSFIVKGEELKQKELLQGRDAFSEEIKHHYNLDYDDIQPPTAANFLHNLKIAIQARAKNPGDAVTISSMLILGVLVPEKDEHGQEIFKDGQVVKDNIDFPFDTYDLDGMGNPIMDEKHTHHNIIPRLPPEELPKLKALVSSYEKQTGRTIEQFITDYYCQCKASSAYKLQRNDIDLLKDTVLSADSAVYSEDSHERISPALKCKLGDTIQFSASYTIDWTADGQYKPHKVQSPFTAMKIAGISRDTNTIVLTDASTNSCYKMSLDKFIVDQCKMERALEKARAGKDSREKAAVMKAAKKTFGNDVSFSI